MRGAREPEKVTVYGVDGVVSISDTRGGGKMEDVGRYPTWRRNSCGWCGEVHPDNPGGWRDARGYKIPCEKCEVLIARRRA